MSQDKEKVLESRITKVVRQYAKYVFLDVVQFSHERSAEAQSDIVHSLNEIIRSSLSAQGIETDGCLFLPTGDGMCIALIANFAFDLHIQLALRILEGLDAYNNSTLDPTKKFQIRIGINQNTDILVTDINGALNIAGAGINLASRLMDLADGNQILVSQTVFDELEPSERYMNGFREYNAEIKHDRRVRSYQFIGGGHAGLNVNVPTKFTIIEKPEPKLTRFAAYYFAHAIKHKQEIIDCANQTDSMYIPVLLYFLAKDSCGMSTASDIRPYNTKTHGHGEFSFKKQLGYYAQQDVYIALDFSEMIEKPFLSNFIDYMERSTYSHCPVFVTDEGIEKLKTEWPAIWKEFALGGSKYSVTIS